MSTETSKNRLAGETSPYLLQHADNPVDWQPWDEVALEEARSEEKPIFLSIGYSACHWCHVMERESFEDEEIAEYLNEHFVPIKVDREERPDLDRIYMNATQMIAGQGGWPMSLFLTPDLEPFYAGTYFPPEDKWGRPGFETILEHIAELWEDERDRVEQIGGEITQRIERATSSEGGGAVDRDPLRRGFESWSRQFDERDAGFGSSPKFPPAMQLRTLLHLWAGEDLDEAERERTLEMVESTLARMASGGMYDQIGGGFHRYSVDERWLVPHFEKMLYDNALLTLAYVDGYRATGRASYRRIVEETLGYVRREMTLEGVEAGAPFFSTQDAESGGVEGKFFVWTPESLREVLDEEEARRAEQYWGITESGNFEEGWSIPNRLHALDEQGDAVFFEELPDEVADIRRRLFEAREQRVAPGTDTKILAAWNGLMIRAMAHAGFHLDEPEYLEAAESAAKFVFEEMVEGPIDGDFELMRTYKDGRARLTGYLDDYAGVAAAWMELFEAGLGIVWLDRAEAMVDRMVELFGDDESGGFFYTGEQHGDLIVRDKDQLDNQTPSGNSLAAGALLRLALLRDRPGLRDRAEEALEAFYPRMVEAPRAMGEMLQWLDFHTDDPLQIVSVVPEGNDGRPFREVLRESYLPNAVRVPVDLGSFDLEDWAERVPVAAGRRPVEGEATAYVCRAGACRRPSTDPEEFRTDLGVGEATGD